MALRGNGIALLRHTAVALALAAAPVHSEPLILHDGDAQRVIGEVATLFEDPTGRLGAAQVLSPEIVARFRPLPSRHPNLGYTASTIWFRFTLQNAENAERRFVLDVGREWLETVQMVDVASGEIQRSGAWIPLRERPFLTERIAFPLALPGGATRSYLVSIASRTPLSLLGSVVPRDSFIDADATGHFAFGGFYAILLALAAYNVIVSLVVREGTHAFLGAGLASYALAEACAHGQVARFFPAAAGFAELSGCCAAFAVFTACFGMWAYRAFEVNDRLRRLDRAFRAAIAASALCCLLAALVPRLHPLTFVGLLLMISSLLPGTIVRVRRADRVGVYLAIALAAFLVPGSAVIGALFGLWPLNAATEQGNHYGAVVMACLFSLVTGERMREATRKLLALNDELQRQVASRSRELALAYLPPRAQAANRLLEMGELIDRRYQVARLLGKGGGGAVYEVTRVADGRPLAVKVLMQVDGTAAARLLREAEIGSRLNHPNLISIVDVGITEVGNPFLAMELVAAGSLDRQRHRFGDAAWASHLLGGIADGLVTLHAAGVVHRDLKPPNILLAAERWPKIADFGIAAFGEEQLARDSAGGIRTLSVTGALLGTPAYMAPEAWDGVGRLGKPADVFAMGLLAYEMLSGKGAFDVPAFLQRAAGRPLVPPVPLEQRVPDLAPLLSRTIDRALSENTELRPEMIVFAKVVHDAFGN